MANTQSSKYKKFMVGAASAALVATAVAPVASAKDFSDTKGNTHEVSIDALSNSGVISGYPDGSFKPNKTLTRSDVVKLMGKWLVSEGYKIPEDARTNPRFKDLTTASNGELLDAAAIVKDNGIFNGSNGNLLAGDNISRENMAVVLVRAFDKINDIDLVSYVKEQDFKKDVIDLNKAKAEARPAIDVLDFFDITSAKSPNFNPKNTTTRGQFATFLYKSINTDYSAVKAPVVNEDLVAVETAATKVISGEVTVARGEQATNANKLEAVQAYVTKLAADTEVVTTVEAAKTAGDYVVTLTKGEEKVEKTIAVKFAYAADDRFVTGVKALNATQVEVKFNVAVSASDIAGKVTIQGVTFNSQSLSADGKVLTVTANAPIDVTNATVIVEPIATKADATVKTEKSISLITYKDVVAPTIASVETVTSGNVATSLTVKASEPLKTGGLVKVDGEYASVNFANTDTATITGLSLEVGKTHTIELINIEDLAGNKTVSTSANFTVSVDASIPAVALTATSEKEILVTFNKSMNVDSVKAALANGSVKSEALAAVKTGKVTEVASSNGTQFIIPVEETIFANKASRTFTVVLADTIKDQLGNKVAASTQTVTLSKDSVKPVAIGYNVVKDADGKVTAIEVDFSEGLVAGTPTLPTIVSENGVAVAASDFLGGLTAQAVTSGDMSAVYKVTTPSKVSGKFVFSFAKNLVADLAETANNSDAFHYTVDFGQEETTSTFSVTSATAASNAITVTFPEAVKGGAVANSATDLANYTLAGKPLPADTTITLNADQKVATITLPAESIAKADQAVVFTASNIQSILGKSLNTYTGTVAVVDNVSPEIVSAKVLDNKTIELTYSENVELTDANAGVFEVGDDFLLTVGSTALTLTAADLKAELVAGFPTKIKITLDQVVNNVATTLDLTEAITVKTIAPTTANVKDKSGKSQKVGTVVNVSK